MFRNLFLSTLVLLAIDGGTTMLAPATGVSLTRDADAAFIRRTKVKKRGSSYKVVVSVRDSGDTTTADLDRVSVVVCEGDLCSDPVDIGTDGYAGVFKSSRFAYDGAVVPVGEYKLQSTLVDVNGKQLGATQMRRSAGTMGPGDGP